MADLPAIPKSAACERNKEPILEGLRKVLPSTSKKLIEVGSGTGQHALHFAPHFPKISWQLTDCENRLEGLSLALNHAPEKYSNIMVPKPYEVGKTNFPSGGRYDLLYTANTFHIMSWKQVKTLIKTATEKLRGKESKFIVYGPFNYEGKFTSESNQLFDQNLKAQDPSMGIRQFEDVLATFQKGHYKLSHDFSMPANNRLLVFQKDAP